jgi:hypothetical protein
VRLVIALFALAGASMGQPVWDKNSDRWTDTDVARILSDSPWAKSATVRVRASDSGLQNPPTTIRVTVRFESALPIRLALLKSGFVPASVADQAKCVVVVQFPGPWAKYSPVAGDWRSAQARLAPAGSASVWSSEVRLIEEKDNVAALVYTFQRSAALAAPRYVSVPFVRRNFKTVSFEANVGKLNLRLRYSIPAMTFMGRIEL